MALEPEKSSRVHIRSQEETGAWAAEPIDPDVPSEFPTEDFNNGLAPAQGPDEIGRIGPFQVVQFLGSGGMGSVYRGIDPSLGRPVALKVMRPQLAGSAVARQRFLREARAVAALEHDHVVAIYEVGESRGIPYLAMPLLHGQSLADRLRQRPPLAGTEVLRIGREIAAGLAAAHARGLTHRDIKPANIWLEEGTGRVKILDFGLARVASESARLTQDGSILGTPAYMAPEQASGSSAVDHRSDLFSLGSVLYRMSTGTLPFPASRSGAMLIALVRDDPVPPRQINPEIPPALEALVLGLLAKDPDRRPQAAHAVVERIRGLERIEPPGDKDGVDLEVTMEEPGPLLPARRASRPLAAVVLSLVVVAGLVAGSLLLPRLLDAAGGTGELILDSPVRELTVRISSDGRTVGVLDPRARPTLRLPVGSYALNLAGATEPLKLAVSRIELRRDGRQVVRVVRNIPAAPARRASEPAPPDVVAALGDVDIRRIAALPAAEQVEEVRKELMRRNPGFDGKVGHKIEHGVVTEFRIVTDMVADISPIRVWSALRVLDCQGTSRAERLANLKPLRGMNLAGLRSLNLSSTQVGDAGLQYFEPCKDLTYLNLSSCTHVGDAGLAHFKDCKNLNILALYRTTISDAGLAHFEDCKNLTSLNLARTKTSDAGLAHLKGCKNLSALWLMGTQVSDAGLADLKSMPLVHLEIQDTEITDLTPLQGMPLEDIRLTPQNITQGLDLLRHRKSLKTIGIAWNRSWPAAEFWERYDKGEFQ